MTMRFVNTFARLPERFFQRIRPEPVAQPCLLLWNDEVAGELGIPAHLSADRKRLAEVFGGNVLLDGTDSVALAYAGHQFGHFVPQLGDGRAHLLGEVVDLHGRGRELQLKGSGPTRFSRGGDGRCGLGPAVREFIMSEALAALGVPTTRTLAVVTTGESVRRQRPLPGAVVARVARSHLRVGTFQFFAARDDIEALRSLADHAISRLYPHLAGTSDVYWRLLDEVINAQIRLVTEWMRVGFVHGVMNTDNTLISGETIDYGPCAMMGRYDSQTVFSSIDEYGRYAYGNQPAILAWNMARLAEAMLPLLADDRTAALQRAQARIERLPSELDTAWLTMMLAKIGLRDVRSGDADLVAQLCATMRTATLDYTITFDRMTRSLAEASMAERVIADLGQSWSDTWHQRLSAQGDDLDAVRLRMRQNNPLVIPRNHHVERVLTEIEQTLDPTCVQDFLQVLRSPYAQLPHTAAYQDAPSDGDREYVTFCGT